MPNPPISGASSFRALTQCSRKAMMSLSGAAVDLVSADRRLRATFEPGGRQAIPVQTSGHGGGPPAVPARAELEIVFRAAEIGRPEGVFIGSHDGGDGAPRRALASRRALLRLSNFLPHFPELLRTL
jgi:hypothetical protein